MGEDRTSARDALSIRRWLGVIELGLRPRWYRATVQFTKFPELSAYASEKYFPNAHRSLRLFDVNGAVVGCYRAFVGKIAAKDSAALARMDARRRQRTEPDSSGPSAESTARR
jgi:hypothetical protein